MFVVVDLLLYYFISDVVGPVPAADLGGAPSYFAFAVSGIVMSLVLMSATADITNRIREEQLTGTLELLCAQPVRTWQLGYGTASFPLAFALVRAVAYLVIAVVALDLSTDSTDWPGVAAMLLTASMAFAPIGVLGAAATIVFKRGGTIAGLLVFAMTFVSGALFPLSLLPEWLQPIGRAMPTRFAFDGLRAALFEKAAGRPTQSCCSRSPSLRRLYRCGSSHGARPRKTIGHACAVLTLENARVRCRIGLGRRSSPYRRVCAARPDRWSLVESFPPPCWRRPCTFPRYVNCIGIHIDCLYPICSPETLIGVLGANTPTITGPRSR